jgi:prevent-host-death family protein
MMLAEDSMIRLTDIRSLTDFKRHTSEILEQLKQTGRPQVLTVNGRAEVVVQDVASYQQLLDLVERVEAIAGIRRGLESAARGEGRPIHEAAAELRTRYDLPTNA